MPTVEQVGKWGLLARLLLRSNPGAGLALLSAAYLYRSVRRGVNRYSNLPVQRLYEGAELVRAVTGAETVIFGHTHRSGPWPLAFKERSSK